MVDRENSLALITSSRSINGVCKARPLTKQFSELQISGCYVMLGIDFSREGTGTPRATRLSGVSTLTWFSLLQYCKPQVDPRGHCKNEH